MKEGVVVVGAGGHAKVVISTLRAAGQNIQVVLDDAPERWDSRVLDVPVVGGTALLSEAERAIIAVGNNHFRQKLAMQYPHVEWITVVHPAAVVDPTVQLGGGTVVFAGAVIQADTTIGAHCIVNTAATIDHDCWIDDCVHLAPGTHLAGNVTVQQGAFLGVGVKVIPGRTVGEWSTVGAGATVVTDLPAKVLAVGTPARPIKALH